LRIFRAPNTGRNPSNPPLRYASRPDVMADAAWRRGISALKPHALPCEIEIAAPQLPGLAALARGVRPAIHSAIARLADRPDQQDFATLAPITNEFQGGGICKASVGWSYKYLPTS
jgi:hypothetical protein